MTATQETLESVEAAFREAHPGFAATATVDELRAAQYARLDEHGEVYLDYTGGGLYAESQLDEHMALLRGAVLGNPHSVNPTSSAATTLVERARAAVLAYFNASPDEYACIFTPNATGALRLVGESYPFEPGGRFLATFDNHNSVNGIREFARATCASPTGCWRRISTTPRRAPASCSRSRHNRTSPGSGTRSSGSPRPMTGAGT